MRKIDRLAALALFATATTLRAQTAPATTQAATAHDLYVGAAALVVAESPSASSFEFPGYPPMGDDWQRLAAAAWRDNADARDMAREANAAATIGWPAGENWMYLNQCRAVANELADAAQYRGLAGDLPAALGFLNDLLDLGDRLRAPPLDMRVLLHGLVAAGIDAMATNRTMILAPELAAAKDVPAEDVKKLIGRLLESPDPAAALEAARADPQTKIEPLRTTFSRGLAERRMAAMSLACQLYRRDKGSWPAKADDLVPAYLPAVPLDPADGKSPLGYVLVARGLPDGGDRPLVYSREESPGGLAYRTDEPQYGFYVDDGSNNAARNRVKAGQFRDVARWAPAKPPVPGNQPALAPLPAP